MSCDRSTLFAGGTRDPGTAGWCGSRWPRRGACAARRSVRDGGPDSERRAWGVSTVRVEPLTCAFVRVPRGDWLRRAEMAKSQPLGWIRWQLADAHGRDGVGLYWCKRSKCALPKGVRSHHPRTHRRRRHLRHGSTALFQQWGQFCAVVFFLYVVRLCGLPRPHPDRGSLFPAFWLPGCEVECGDELQGEKSMTVYESVKSNF